MPTLILAKQIEDDGRNITEITLREPTGNDVIECGMPWRFKSSDDTGANFRMVDTEAVGLLIARLSGVSYATVNRMSAPDFMKANAIVMGFFTSSATESSA